MALKLDPRTGARVQYGFFDRFTKEPVVYEEITQPWSDAQCDGVLARKIDGVYYRRVVGDGYVNLCWYGLKGDNQTDNLPLFKAVLDRLPIKDQYSFRLPKGVYRFSGTLEIRDKPINLVGEVGTILDFPPGCIGVLFNRAHAGPPPIWENLIIQARAKDPQDGLLPNGSYSIDTGDYRWHGVQINTVVQMKYVSIRSFSGHGLKIDANIFDKSIPGAGQDASLGYYERVSLFNNRHGMVIGGADANQCTFLHFDIRDHPGYGVIDYSFLGNQYISCHANSNALGHYHMVNENNRSTLIACYGEGGNPPSVFRGVCTVLGGIHDSGKEFYNGAAYLEGGLLRGQLEIGALRLLPSGVNHIGSVHTFRFKPVNGDGTQFAYSLGDGDQDSWQLIGPETRLLNSNNRLSNIVSQNFREHFLNGHLRGFVEDFPAVESYSIYNRIPFRQGDVIYNENYTGSNPRGWVCFAPGAYTKTYTEGRLATRYTGESFTLNQPSNVLKVGDAVRFGDRGYEITRIRDLVDNSGDRLLYDVKGTMPPFTNVPVEFARPRWKALEHGSGTLAQRPTSLRADDAGWRYFATDEAAWSTWSGTAWVAG